MFLFSASCSHLCFDFRLAGEQSSMTGSRPTRDLSMTLMLIPVIRSQLKPTFSLPIPQVEALPHGATQGGAPGLCRPSVPSWSSLERAWKSSPGWMTGWPGTLNLSLMTLTSTSRSRSQVWSPCSPRNSTSKDNHSSPYSNNPCLACLRSLNNVIIV